MIRGENSKNHNSGCFGILHPGTTSQNFRTTDDRDLVSLAKLFGMMNRVKKCFDVQSTTSWWDDLVPSDQFLVKKYFLHVFT